MNKNLGDVINPADIRLPERRIEAVFWHCSASDRPEHDSVRVMDAWHRERGMARVGYHAFIRKDGVIEMGRTWETEPAAQAPHNTATLAFCVHGLKLELFTLRQMKAVRALAEAVVDAAAMLGRPVPRHRGHREVAAKACPVFNYRSVLGLDVEGYMHPAVGVEWEPVMAGMAVGSSHPHVHGALRLFDRGPEVVRLQEALNRSGAFLDTDGVFGRATQRAVEGFQAVHDLLVDGVVGPKTWAALGRGVQG